MPLKITIYTSFAEAEASWRAFEREGLYYAFQRFEWLEQWYRRIGRHQDLSLCLVAVMDQAGRPLYFLPLGIKRQSGLKILSWLGGLIADYQAPLLGQAITRLDSRAQQAIWREVKHHLPAFDAARFICQPALIGGHANPFVVPGATVYADSHASTLGDDWEGFYRSRIKSRKRLDINRRRRRLAERGAVRFVIAGSDAEVAAITEAMIHQKRRRYQETGVVDLLADENYRGFYRQMGREHRAGGLVHICALYVDDLIVATHWGMVLGDRFYFLMPAYEDGEWKQYSVGRLLLEEMLQWCVQQGIAVFDFTLGDESYKMEWCDQHMDLYQTLDARSWLGHGYVQAQRLKRRLLNNPVIYRHAMKLRTYLLNRNAVKN